MKRPFRVLIVEDERITAKSLKCDLEDFGMNVLEPASKGEDAVQIALRENPDLILMDIHLAGRMDGIEAAEDIMRHKKIPIIFMTGYATDYIRERSCNVDPVGFLEKPIQTLSITQIVYAMDPGETID
ncbi:response regulator [bacterium]|nr:response regulator [bacterium]